MVGPADFPEYAYYSRHGERQRAGVGHQIGVNCLQLHLHGGSLGGVSIGPDPDDLSLRHADVQRRLAPRPQGSDRKECKIRV